MGLVEPPTPWKPEDLPQNWFIELNLEYVQSLVWVKSSTISRLIFYLLKWALDEHFILKPLYPDGSKALHSNMLVLHRFAPSLPVAFVWIIYFPCHLPSVFQNSSYDRVAFIYKHTENAAFLTPLGFKTIVISVYTLTT